MPRLRNINTTEAKWTDDEAVSEAFRLMEKLGMPTNQVVKHRYYATAITVSSPSGEKVRVTPFHDVQMSKDLKDEYSSILRVEFRVDEELPGRVTHLSCWPPIKLPW